ncbi:MAG: hypothetical protein IJU40_00220, partial [Desulfovibrionaceae bacterium]|nr:hypothetical protein [Desulfovibrionaceae bacterium]
MALTSKGSRPPFFFFIGPDMLLFKEEIDRLISSYPPSFGTWQKKVYWGDDSPTPKFWGEFTLSQLLGTSTYLVLRYANKWSASTWEKLDIVLKETSASCWPLIFLEVPNERGHPKIPSHISKAQSLKLAKKKGWVYANPGLTTNSILEYIKAQAAQFYPHIPPQILFNVSLEIP